MLYIYTVCYNTPQYIEPQYKLLKKYVENDFQYIVFNNTMTNKILKKENYSNNNVLNSICNKLNIKVINLGKNLFIGMGDDDASRRAGTAINAAHAYLFQNYPLDSTFFLIDTDAFLLSPFDVNKFMENKKLSGRIQYRKKNGNEVRYITNHVVIYKPYKFGNYLKFFSFLPGPVNGINCDCGGNINYILDTLKENEFVNWTNKLFSNSGNIKQQWGTAPDSKKDFNMEALTSMDNSNLKDYIIQDTSILKKEFPFCEIFENTNTDTIFLHMRAGTNWINYNIENRNKILFTFLNKLLK